MAGSPSFKDQCVNFLDTFFSRIKTSLLSSAPPGYGVHSSSDIPSIRELEDLANRHTFSSLLPYESYDSDDQIYYNKDTIGFMLYCMPSTGIGTSELNILNGIFDQPHKPKSTFQITLYADPNVEFLYKKWMESKLQVDDEDLKETFRILAENRIAFLKKGKWNSLFKDQSVLPKNFHLIITYSVPLSSTLSDEAKNEAIESLIRIKGSTQGALNSARIFSQNLAPELFINIMNGMLNPFDGEHPYLRYDENKGLAEQVISSDTALLVDNGVSSIIHNDKHYSVVPFHARQFPESWHGSNNRDIVGSFFNNILRLPCPAVLTLTITVPDQIAVKSKSKRKSARATQMASTKLAEYAPTLKERKRDWAFVEKRLKEGNKMMDAYYQVLLFMPEGKEQQCEQTLKGIYDTIGWTLERSRFGGVLPFIAALPMGLEQKAIEMLYRFKYYSPYISQTLTNIAPWIAEWKGHQNPVLMFLGRLGQVCFVDPFSNIKGNYNIACCANSGGGKSFLCNEWIYSVMGTGGRAFVIDAGHSYRELCNLFKGTYIDFGVGQPNLNPFTKLFGEDVTSRIEADPKLSLKEYISDHMPMLIMIIGQMASPERALDSKQNSILEQGIERAVSIYHGKTTISRVAEQLKLIKDHEEGSSVTAQNLAIMLHSYTEGGMYGRYFEGENNIDMDNRFVVLELDALNAKGALQSVVLLILMLQINQVMYLSGDKKQKKICIIDEAWRLLGGGRSGAFIEEGFRVARKHGGSFMTITQKISDYFSSDTARAAYMSSDFTFLLTQKSEELMQAVKSGYMEDNKESLNVLLSLETKHGYYSELVIKSPDGSSLVRFNVDAVTEKIYSTKASEVQFIQEAKARGVGLMDAINQLLKSVGGR